MASDSSETLWAEHGLTGLVLSALFGLILLFLRTTSRKDAAHQDFIRRMMDDEREERRLTRAENSENTSKLSDAIDKLAVEIRNTNSSKRTQ